MISKLKEKYLTPWKNKTFIQSPNMGINEMMKEYEKDCEQEREKYPIRYFLFETLPLEIKTAWIQFVNVPYWHFVHKYSRNHQYHIVRTELDPKDYHDPDEIMLYACMKLLKDYVETEKEYTEIGEELQKVYDWWIDYPDRLKEIDDAYDQFNLTLGNEFLNHGVELEEKIREEEDEMLAILLKNRRQLWYL